MRPPLFDIQDVSLLFDGIEKPIISKANYQVDEGDFIIVLGSNGSGKSSLLKLLDGRYQPSSGQIFLGNQLLTTYSPKIRGHFVKTLTQYPQESLFNSLTVLENYRLVKQQALFSTQKKCDREFFLNYLKTFSSVLGTKLDQVVDQLSGGEKQTLALALIMLYPPRVLLLDEHTSALDPHTAVKLMSLTASMAAKYRITCLLTTHDLSIAEQYGNRILALKRGEVYQCIDSDEKIKLNKHDLLAACY